MNRMFAVALVLAAGAIPAARAQQGQFRLEVPGRKPGGNPNPRSVEDFRNRALVRQVNQDLDGAIADYTAAIKLEPKQASLYMERGRAHVVKGDYDSAIKDCDESIRLDKEYELALLVRADAWRCKGNPARERADYEAVLRLNEDNPLACSNLAWHLATSPDDKLRDGARAVKLAQRACEQWEWKVPQAIDTLAAAAAEAGDFEAAVKWAKRAVQQEEDEDSQEEFRAHLALFEQHMPYREPVKK